MTLPDERPDPRLAGLPRSITPARDLWPGVEERLRRRRGAGTQGRRWLSVAGLATAAAMLLFLRTPSALHPSPSSESTEMQLVLNATTGPRSATARSLAHYLAILDGAIAETAAALRESPGDPALTDFLQTLERRRLALLAQAARFAAES